MLTTIAPAVPTVPIRSDFLLRRPAPEAGSKSRLHSGTDDKAQSRNREALRCRTCDAPITDSAQAVSRQERHEHAFFNPTGIAFQIRCFREAPGCLVQGKPTAEFSWFTGYQWQYALCGSCLSHLGWLFSSRKNSAENTDAFFALIARKIY
ncbi:MAG: cereblon family protein [Candidatus Electrothrix sp. YB6]